MIDHDESWLSVEDEKRRVVNMQNLRTEKEHFESVFDFAKRYHEHMRVKEKEASDKFQSLAIEQECKICNYTFKGLLPCKCHLRVSADIWQAVVDKHQIVERGK